MEKKIINRPLRSRRNPEKSRRTTVFTDVKNTKSILKNIKDGKEIEPLIKNEKICPQIKIGEILGEGSFGIVAKLENPKFTLPVIVKKIKEKEKNIGFGSEIFTETVIGATLAEDYNKGEIFNYPRLFSSFICKNRAHTISERLTGNIDDFEEIMGRRITDVDVHNILFQLLAALHFAQRKYFFMHRDLHPGNFMLQKIIPDLKFQGKKLNKVKNFTYNIDGILYTIPNLGYILKIIDLGTASIIIPVKDQIKMVAQDIVLSSSWDGLEGGRWGNFGPNFESSLDPIFAFISLRQDIPVNAYMPELLSNNVYSKILNDMVNNKTGYLKPDNVRKSIKRKSFPKKWWTIKAQGLPRPYGDLPNNIFSPSAIINRYFSNIYKNKKAKKKDYDKFMII